MIPRQVRRLAVLATVLTVLAACGGTFVPPAALVNGVPITEDQLQARLHVAMADPSLAGQLTGAGGDLRRADLARQVLSFLIKLRVIAAYAQGRHISVSAADVRRSLNQAIQQAGGKAAFDRDMRSLGLTLPDVEENIRESILTDKVRQAVARQRLGVGAGAATPQQVAQVFGVWLRAQLDKSRIEVNPRFGAYDPKTTAVCRITSTAGDLKCPSA